LTGDAPGFDQAPYAGILKNGMNFSLERPAVCLGRGFQFFQDAVV
jgi:hypothetical protein